MTMETDDEELVLTPEMEAPGGDDDDHGSIDTAAEVPQAEEYDLELEGEEPADDTPLIKDLRQQLADAKRENAEHRKQTAPKPEVGKKPDLWDDCDGDPDKFEAEITAYHERKRQAENADREAADQQDIRNREFERKVTSYRQKLAALPLPETVKAEAEKHVVAVLPQLLQSALVSYTDDPAKVVVALAKHPAKLAQLAQETDPIRFILAVREIEGKIKVKRNAPPAPESDTVQRGTVAMSQATSDKVERELEKKAEKTGNYTELFAYRRNKRAAA